MIKNRVVYGTVLFISAVCIFLFEHRVTYTALYAVLLLPIIPAITLIIAKRHIYIAEKFDTETVKKGEKFRYIINIKNNNYIFNFKAKAVFGKNIRRFFNISKSGTIYLPPRGNSETVFEMLGKYRGTFYVGADYILIYDFLCLFKIRIKNGGCLKLTVLPDIHNLSNLPVSPLSLADNSKTDWLSTTEYSDFPDFEKYSPSDGYKKIHWQLSAKRGELISKSSNNSTKPTALVLFDNSQFPADINRTEAMHCGDSLIEAAVSVMTYCTDMALSVYFNSIDRIQETPSPGFNDLYLSASNIEFDRNKSFSDFLMDADIIEMCRNTGNIYIFTKTVTESFVDSIKRLCSFKCNIVVFYYKISMKKRTKIYENHVERLQLVGAVCYMLSNEISIAEAIERGADNI